MFRVKLALTVSLAGLLVGSASAVGQSAAAPHTIVVKLIERGGAMPYAFEPAEIFAQRGDTVVFVEAAGAIHDVHFTVLARGAKLGAAATSPYFTSKGQTYQLVIDQRFAEGTYEYVCEPHEALGMKGTLVVKSVRGTASTR